jgi:hypothetical protein
VSKSKKTFPDFPPDVIEADTKWPPPDDNPKPWRTGNDADVPRSLTFYKVQGARIKDAWVIVTLPIDNRGRSYVVQCETGSTGRAGRGPHVKAEVTVYLTRKNIDRLRRYVDLWRKGAAEAGMIRDRISTRRVQGQIERAKGKTSWRWDS